MWRYVFSIWRYFLLTVRKESDLVNIGPSLILDWKGSEAMTSKGKTLERFESCFDLGCLEGKEFQGF